jgi:TatD DNase family protein
LNLDVLHTNGIKDVHTHNMNAGASAVYNILPPDFSNFVFKANHFYSAGIHPWYIDEDKIDAQFYALSNLLSTQTQILLIGECGLDKIKGPEYKLQVEVFNRHLALAVQFQKPIIIHCVKAYQEVLAIINQVQFNLPFIFHGFNKSLELAQQIIAAGGSISLGLRIQKDAAHIDKYLKALPKEKIFFESDDLFDQEE